MGSADLSTDRAFEILTPAPAMRAGPDHSTPADARARARRRARPEEQDHENDLATSDAGDQPAHQLDDLA